MRQRPAQGPQSPRQLRGLVACSAGRMGEDCVTRAYVETGHEILATRWLGEAGEIDLILRRGDEIVFVEVKTSTSHALAAERVSRGQMDRICQAALEFCAGIPTGVMTPMRFDAALVDQFGQVKIIENAFGMS